jgi:uncharacterized protein (DUF362 family)
LEDDVYRARPRKENVFKQGGKPIVAKVPHLNGDYMADTLIQAVDLLGGLSRAIRPGDHVLIKANFNCSFALPLSTDRAFLAAAIEILQEGGAIVKVGELSGRSDWPTDKVIDNLKILPVLKRYCVEFVNFEHDEWISMAVNGRYWESFRVPRAIYESDKRVYLPNMRCHGSARFSGALKLSVGWIDLQDRDRLHQDRDKIEGRVAELNLGWQPDLVLMDWRRSTVAWNGRGEYIYPNVVMASGDMVAVDTEAVRILKQYPGKNRIDIPIEDMEQLKVGQEHGLGSMEYILLQGPANTHTIQESISDADARW